MNQRNIRFIREDYILFGYLFHLEASDRKLLFVKYFYRINNYINLLGDQNPTEISR